MSPVNSAERDKLLAWAGQFRELASNVRNFVSTYQGTISLVGNVNVSDFWYTDIGEFTIGLQQWLRQMSQDTGNSVQSLQGFASACDGMADELDNLWRLKQLQAAPPPGSTAR